ncbi:protein FATTY ACID EXPORT 3, chloroplastic [Trifolium repens]|nr:protein FATTY ACID EXPORT 3, chloroplastic [Trifolium repens]
MKMNSVEVEKKKGNDVDLEVDWSEIVEPLQELRELLQELSNKIITKMMDNFDLIMKEINEEPDLTFMAKEITEEGKKYFSSAIETSPEVKEIVDTFTSPDDDELNNVSSVQDFYVGIPYGLILSLGGFLSFMITGSIAAIRFGVILGGVLLALSISSLKSYKKGQPSSLALKGGQIAIVSILFLREISSVGRGSTYITALISGAVAAFYVYRLVLEGKTQKGSNLEGEAGN